MFGDDGADRLWALHWIDAIARYVNQRAQESGLSTHDVVTTAANLHYRETGHKLSLGCCRRRPLDN